MGSPKQIAITASMLKKAGLFDKRNVIIMKELGRTSANGLTDLTDYELKKLQKYAAEQRKKEQGNNEDTTAGD
jgi:hypothetical protein